MAKRFTDTELWNEDWFIDLTTVEKLFWFYIKDNCDHAGIWRINKRKFEMSCGLKVDIKDFLIHVNVGKDRILLVGEDRLYLNGFIKFQYGEISPLSNSPLHKSVFKTLSAYDIGINDFTPNQSLPKGLNKGSPTLKDKDKEIKEKGGVGGKEKSAYQILLDEMNAALGKSFAGDTKSTEQFVERMAEGRTLDDFRRALANYRDDPYHAEQGWRYITPSYITRADKLDEGINMKSNRTTLDPDETTRKNREEWNRITRKDTATGS